VDVYRLLGKAYLESQQYGEAGDIFQRVLSSVPDDFIANVGMSLIREDEGNIDEAIWHLERAFEIQPSNGAVQDELRRLYGRRDNVEPPKIRLTRGALARMYFKGELYQQAISEIRVALGENPNRFDLQSLLAEIYMRTNQTVEAADTAVAVLRRLPNCLIANRVMLQVLTGSDRESERKSYQQRLSQLDPYSAFTTPDNPEAEAVPEQRIKLEKLDWKPEAGGLESASQPVWAASLGVDLEDLAPQQGKDVLPEWLTKVSPAAEEMDETIDEQLYASPLQGEESEQASVAAEKDEEEIPDWLREAGWESAT